jgi:hypothetical protein
MSQPDVVKAFRELLLAAQDFEAKAAKHTRIERERVRLREALLQAQFLLSVLEREEHAQRSKRLQEAGYSLLRSPIEHNEGRATA